MMKQRAAIVAAPTGSFFSEGFGSVAIHDYFVESL